MRHCDEYINDKTQPKCLRKFLLWKRISAAWQLMRWKDSWGKPKLFATQPAYRAKNGRRMAERRVQVTMASRFGDVGVTSDLKAEYGYSARLMVEQLTDFSESP